MYLWIQGVCKLPAGSNAINLPHQWTSEFKIPVWIKLKFLQHHTNKAVLTKYISLATNTSSRRHDEPNIIPRSSTNHHRRSFLFSSTVLLRMMVHWCTEDKNLEVKMSTEEWGFDHPQGSTCKKRRFWRLAIIAFVGRTILSRIKTQSILYNKAIAKFKF